MTKRQRTVRLRIILVLVLSVLSVFGLRLFQIQGIDANAWAAMAENASKHEVRIPAQRGDIVDRNGEVMAGTVDAVALTANPTMTAANAPAIARVILEHLDDDVDYFDMVEKLRKPDTQFVYLERKVPTWKSSAILKDLKAQKIPGIFVEPETLRTYPGGSLAANLLGFLDGSGMGVSGIEKTYHEQLTGTDGVRRFAMSPQGERLPQGESHTTDAVPGQDVVTTVDRDLQWYADQRLAEQVRSVHAGWGLAITMDIKTGEILQSSQYPSFNPDTRQNMTNDRTVNRAVQNVYEPGSVQKLLTMASVVDQGKASATTKVRIPGAMDVGGFTIGDAWDHGTIKLTAAGVIAKSSNLGTVVASQQISSKSLYDYLRAFGLGRRTGIGLAGESNGILSDPSNWGKAEKSTISFGQGVSVTAMQMIAAVGAIANGGVYVQPSIVKGIGEEDGISPVVEPKTHRVISKRASAEVLKMMEATLGEGGSAPLANIDGYRVAGKTGTAWRIDPDTGRYVGGQYTVSFAGVAPADDPRFVTYVVIDNPRGSASGGYTAAPVFKDIMKTALERFGVAPSGTETPATKLEW